jgi:hypothetical protein
MRIQRYMSALWCGSANHHSATKSNPWVKDKIASLAPGCGGPFFCVTVQGFPGKTQAAALMSTMRVLGRWQRLWPHTPDLFFWTNNLTFKVA